MVFRGITHDEYDKLIVQMKSKEEQLHDEMRSHSKADETFLISCSYLLELLQRASDLFARSQAAQKNRLLRFVLANASVKGEKLIYNLKSPFSGIVQCVKSQEWLPILERMRTDWAQDIIDLGREIKLTGFVVPVQMDERYYARL
ncbi:MAG: hypothetical protein PHN33_00630 [Candidatus Peribacteraceae bacterium]|nr:hypothetical protein [Candidatus Peribacteraceae bacterium]